MNAMNTASESTTEGVTITVSPRYHPERSDPASRHWFFSYTVRIENTGPQPARLLSRHWIITDATGREEHVRGPGVVGEQPRLVPGATFQYTSFCPLPTSMGTMHGTFQMVRDDGVSFDAQIAPFTLVDPLDCN